MLKRDEIVCTLIDAATVICNGTKFELPEESLSTGSTWFWIYLGLYIFLMLFAGLMSGLTLGLLSLDNNQLEVLQAAGKPSERKYAKQISPIVKRHHLLLVTLLLANAGAVEAMPIFMDKITNPVVAVLVSVTAVLIFGEIIPQALCSRYGLAIGYYLSPLVYFLMFVMFIVAWPISKLLDCLLGENHATFFRRSELKALVDLHLREDLENEEPLSIDETLIIQGALDLKNKSAKDSLIPIESVVMLSCHSYLDENTMDLILGAGHSRVPVFEGDRNNIIGVLLVKQLIKLNPKDEVPLKNHVNRDSLLVFKEDEPLYNILNAFQTGRSHMCIVKRTEYTMDGQEKEIVVGLLTLEDVIEEILQEEIIDETDKYIDVARRIRVARLKRKLSKSGLSMISRAPSAAPSVKGLWMRSEEKQPLLAVPN